MQETRPVDRVIWLNGQLVPWGDATVHVLSHSLQRGSLVFDYMALNSTPRGPAVFRLDLHLQRMLRSCELMGLPIGLDEVGLSRAVIEAARANPDGRAIKASAYFASLELDVVPVDSRVSVAIAVYDPAEDLVTRSPGKQGAGRRRSIRIWLEKEAHQRREDIVSPQAKVSANYASSMTAKARAQRLGFDEILLIDEEGHVAEGPTSNVFVVDREGVLVTPPEKRVLKGVTRQSIIELAQDSGIALRERPIEPEELAQAREIFMTGTKAGVLPVESIDDHAIGEECPGPLSLALGERLSRAETGQDPAFDHWLTYIEEGARE